VRKIQFPAGLTVGYFIKRRFFGSEQACSIIFSLL
jgi:hypothetical protein